VGVVGSGVSGMRYAGLIEQPTPTTEATHIARRPTPPTPNKQDLLPVPPPALNNSNRQ
jgi:hypothetical protein